MSHGHDHLRESIYICGRMLSRAGSRFGNLPVNWPFQNDFYYIFDGFGSSFYIISGTKRSDIMILIAF